MVGQDPIADMNTEILKMPLGFIRIVQLPMIILAFSTLASYSVKVEFEAPNVKARTLQWGYPFALTDTKLEDTPLTIPVQIGVLSMSFFFTDSRHAKGLLLLSSVNWQHQSINSSDTSLGYTLLFHQSYSSASYFYVFVGVKSMLLVN